MNRLEKFMGWLLISELCYILFIISIVTIVVLPVFGELIMLMSFLGLIVSVAARVWMAARIFFSGDDR